MFEAVIWEWDLAEVVGLILALLFVFIAGVGIYIWNRPLWYRKALLGGLVLRLLFVFLYIDAIGVYYGGGDYDNYVFEGSRLFDLLLSRNFEAYVSSSHWVGGQFWGTAALNYIISLVGWPFLFSLHGVSIFFSTLAYVGVICFAEAFDNAFPREMVKRYVWIVVFFPSLSFWTSVVGKDALLLLGLGLVFLGVSRYALPATRKRKLPLILLGMALVFLVRPQVAALVGGTLGVSMWLGSSRRWSLMRVVQGVTMLAGGVWIGVVGLNALGIDASGEGVSTYSQTRSEVTAAQVTISGVSAEAGGNPVLGLVNVFFRPFPWEARSITLLLSSMELVAVWSLILMRWRSVHLFVRRYRRNPFFVMAVFFLFIYALAFGTIVSNLGMIARQRIHIFPMLVVLVAAAPRRKVYLASPDTAARVPVVYT